MFEIILLTHERELDKPTNTGQLVRACLGQQCCLVVWQRKVIDSHIESLVKSETVALLYPEDTDKIVDVQSDISDSAFGSSEQSCSEFESFIILDATWQQARKMFNQSPYLKYLPRVSLHVEERSRFKLRRNQKLNGLCTAETCLNLLRQLNQNALADKLEAAFHEFNAS